MYEDKKLDDVDTDLALLAFDSSTISVSLKLCNWALGKYSRGDVRMHTLLDLRGNTPVQIHIFTKHNQETTVGGHLCTPPADLGEKPYRSSYTITEIATLVSISLFEKTDLNELLTTPKRNKVT